jgi:nucleoid-associated protein YgaU
VRARIRQVENLSYSGKEVEMGKEAKMGVAFIALLLGVFGFVLYKRLKDSQQPAEQAASAGVIQEQSAASKKPTLSSGPLKQAAGQAALPTAAESSQDRAGSSPTRDSSTRYGDSLAGDSSMSRTRSGESYGSSTPPAYGASEADAYADTAATTASDAMRPLPATTASQSDPFNRYGERASSGTLTPTADASAALLPASATADSDSSRIAVPYASTRSAVEDTDDAADVSPTANPLRSSSADSENKSAATTSTRFSGPRNYDLYGGNSTVADTSTSAASSGSDAGNSRMRYGETAGSRYGSEAPSRSQWSGSSSASTSVAPTPSTATASRSATSASEQRTPRVPVASAAGHRGETYAVEPNDNFWTISEKVYGASSYFKALQEHNRSRYPRPDLLKTGDVVATPSLGVLAQKYPSLCPKPQHLPPTGRTSTLTAQRSGGRTYVVEEGDTLFDIARFELGKATRWAEIYELNKELIGEDFNHLRPGTQLTLPADAQDDSFTRRPASSLKR